MKTGALAGASSKGAAVEDGGGRKEKVCWTRITDHGTRPIWASDELARSPHELAHPLGIDLTNFPSPIPDLTNLRHQTTKITHHPTNLNILRSDEAHYDSETIEQVKRNHEGLKELCDTSTEIITFLHEQIVQHGSTAAVKFKKLCEDLESYLQVVVLEIQTLQKRSKGLRGRVRVFFRSRSITEEIAGYEKHIQEVRSNLELMAIVETTFKVADMHPQVHETNSRVKEMHAAIMGPAPPVVQAVPNVNMCPLASRIFHGRQTILNKMHQFFTESSNKQLIYALYGLGGAGKTQAALKFIQDSSGHFTDIFLVDASNPETIDTGLKNIATAKGVGTSAPDALTWLQSKHEDWLLFFDNADDPEINLNSFIPQCNHGNILITSRNPGIRAYGSYSHVGDLEEADAINLLLRSADMESSENNVKVVMEIVQELCCLPLAIVQAGAFILGSEDLNGYLELYHSNRAHLLSKQPVQSHDDYAWTVYTTWQISFNRLSKPAATLLQLCSFLHYTGISEDIFINASEYDFPEWKPSKEELQEPLEFLSHFLSPSGEWDSLRFLAAIKEIKDYSLISFDAKTKTFSIHPLVHKWSRSTVADEVSCLSCMSSIFGNTFAVEFWSIYYNAFRLREAQDIAEKDLRKRKLLFGEEHEATIGIMYQLSRTCLAAGEYRKAEELAVMVVEGLTKLVGKDHLSTLSAMNNLATVYLRLGQPQKVLELLVLEKTITTFGEDGLSTLNAMTNLGSAYHQMGDHTKAEGLRVVVLEKQSKIFGGDHAGVMDAMMNLAATYHELGEFAKADQLFAKVLETRTNLLGEGHPQTLLVLYNLAEIYRRRGEYQKAEQLQVIVLEKRTTVLGGDHPDTVLAMVTLSLTYHRLGQYKKAEALNVVVLEKRTRLLGGDHPDTVQAMISLSLTYDKLGQYKKAEELEVIVLQAQTRCLGEDHPDTICAMGNLALSYRALGDHKKAEELQVVIFEKQKKILGDSHPDTMAAQNNLAYTHEQLGKLNEARELEQLINAPANSESS
ncbi:hypothetical protein C8R46DRAFT_1184309 [Mycena filopes]|nr:hypothetical protein C8R46DRAFT_1184309 [Mycena filopes]